MAVPFSFSAAVTHSGSEAVRASVDPRKCVCAGSVCLCTCCGGREKDEEIFIPKKSGLSNTSLRQGVCTTLSHFLCILGEQTRWGRGTGNGPAAEPFPVIPFPVFVSYYGRFCVTSVGLCFLPSQINGFYVMSTRWYSVAIRSFCFLFVWFYLFLKLWIFSPLTP